MQLLAVLLLGWTAVCIWAVWRAHGPRLLLLPMVLLAPGASTPAYVAFVYPEHPVVAGQFVGGILLMGVLAFAARRRHGPLLALIAILLALPLTRVATLPPASLQALGEQAARAPLFAIVYGLRVLAILSIFYIVTRRRELLSTLLPGSKPIEDQTGVDRDKVLPVPVRPTQPGRQKPS